ncbi:MAG: hypothetical protein MHM6MM_003229 [Cercozoa sp. M6MM]
MTLAAVILRAANMSMSVRVVQVKLRFMLRRLRPVERTLRSQVDTLVALAQRDVTAQVDTKVDADALTARPNFSLSDSEEEEGNDEQGEADAELAGMRMSDGSAVETDARGLYVAPKRSATEMLDREARRQKELEKLRRQEEQLARSELVREMRNEMGDEPEMHSATGLHIAGASKQDNEYFDERDRFEENMMMRLPETREHRRRVAARERQVQESAFDFHADMRTLSRIHRTVAQKDRVESEEMQAARSDARREDAFSQFAAQERRKRPRNKGKKSNNKKKRRRR